MTLLWNGFMCALLSYEECCGNNWFTGDLIFYTRTKYLSYFFSHTPTHINQINTKLQRSLSERRTHIKPFQVHQWKLFIFIRSFVFILNNGSCVTYKLFLLFLFSSSFIRQVSYRTFSYVPLPPNIKIEERNAVEHSIFKVNLFS